jgi:hypothetical protein
MYVPRFHPFSSLLLPHCTISHYTTLYHTDPHAFLSRLIPFHSIPTRSSPIPISVPLPHHHSRHSPIPTLVPVYHVMTYLSLLGRRQNHASHSGALAEWLRRLTRIFLWNTQFWVSNPFVGKSSNLLGVDMIFVFLCASLFVVGGSFVLWWGGVVWKIKILLLFVV